MENFAARTVFFVKDAEEALRFYTETLGFALDWNHKEQNRAWVFQVSLHGFQLILNQEEPWSEKRAGHGRIFIALDDDQTDVLRAHLERHRLPWSVREWGAPTLVVEDLDRNELYFWLPEAKHAGLIDRPPS